MRYRSRAAFAVCCALSLAGATPASAATVIGFGGGSSPMDGADGNIRSFMVDGIRVQASGWSYNGSELEQAWLGRYNNGLGVTDNGEGDGSNNRHAVDNRGQDNFILLVFDQAVNISDAILRPYAFTTAPADNDAAVSFANLDGLFTRPPSAFLPDDPLFAALGGNLWNVSGNNTANFLTDLQSDGRFGNVWLIGAATSNPDSRPDGFRLRSITVTAVPEPGTWAMMLMGFGFVGAAIRRRQTRVPALAA